jgi:hypothetical protein
MVIATGIRWAGDISPRANVGVMSATKAPPLLVLALVALFLYWVVQDPVGAAAMIREVFDWSLGFLQLLAERVVQFLSALT